MLKIRGDSKEGTNDSDTCELFFGENEFSGAGSKIEKTFCFCKHLKKNRGSAPLAIAFAPIVAAKTAGSSKRAARRIGKDIKAVIKNEWPFSPHRWPGR
jgi:hypothetical protein